MKSNPARYEDLQPEIMQAYAEENSRLKPKGGR